MGNKTKRKMPETNEACSCGCRNRLTTRLINSFALDEWAVGSEIGLEEVGNWLSIDAGDVETLIAVGLLRGFDRMVRLTDLVAFIEETGWLRRAADRQLERLQAGAADLESREKSQPRHESERPSA